jgi:hypothetical protein
LALLSPISALVQNHVFSPNIHKSFHLCIGRHEIINFLMPIIWHSCRYSDSHQGWGCHIRPPIDGSGSTSGLYKSLSCKGLMYIILYYKTSHFIMQILSWSSKCLTCIPPSLPPPRCFVSWARTLLFREEKKLFTFVFNSWILIMLLGSWSRRKVFKIIRGVYSVFKI